MTNALKTLWRILPEGPPKRLLWTTAKQLLPRRLYASPSCNYALVSELAKLQVAAAAADPDGKTATIRLAEPERVFYGYASRWHEKAIHAALPAELRARIPEACCRVAVDIVCRYMYPQALADAAPEYPHKDRYVFHPQHRDVIDDLADLSTEKKNELKRIFAVHPGDVLVDVGAFIGFGAMRLSELVGPEGHVVSIEAHPSNQELLNKNLQENAISNVSAIPKGVWHEPGQVTLHCDEFQRNSLVDEMVTDRGQVTVPTDSVDNIVRDLGLSKVSLVSVTINGAEIEALQGMQRVLSDHRPRISLAGWYHRDGVPVHESVTKLLHKLGYQTIVGPVGRVYAWKA
jgi:FkbM family methyltransferase